MSELADKWEALESAMRACGTAQLVRDRLSEVRVVLGAQKPSKPPIRAREPIPGAHLRGDGEWCAYLYDINGACNKCGFMVGFLAAADQKDDE